MARVVPYGLVEPARHTPGVAVEAVASRSLDKARSFASTQAIPRTFGSYAELLEDPDIDAVYVALPNALNALWVRRALEAGKHVLCEKPLTADAGVAEALMTCARRNDRVLHEAMHVRYLPKLRRLRELVTGGDFGALRGVESCLRLPRIPMADGDFRLQYELGGGAGLDLGCYAASCLRYIGGEEPEVISARHRRIAPEVDRWMRAVLRFPSGARGVLECGFRGWYRKRMVIGATCERGRIELDEDGVAWRKNGRTGRESIAHGWTYQLQIDAFARSVRGEDSAAPPPDDAVGNARVLGAMYAAAGLAPRPTIEG